MKYSGIGGQALIEGIMMKNSDDYSVAVRKSDGTIEVYKDKYISLVNKSRFFKLPIVRGFIALIDSMALGMKTLEISASYIEDDEEDNKNNDNNEDKKLNLSVIMPIIIALSTIVAILLFVLLPMFISHLLSFSSGNIYFKSVIEGLLRIIIFVVYILVISRSSDIKRTFMYHGAEHKCINCIEHGLELNVENVMKSSKEHKRCGTSFMIFIMIISIILFMFIRTDSWIIRSVTRILFIPIIAGLSYEVLKMAGKKDSKFIDILSKPGLWMQRLTTKEPDEKMVEVAIKAVEEVFDWKQYLKDNFNYDI